MTNRAAFGGVGLVLSAALILGITGCGGSDEIVDDMRDASADALAGDSGIRDGGNDAPTDAPMDGGSDAGPDAGDMGPVPGVLVSSDGDLVTMENGGSDTFSVVLATAPTSDVTCTVTSSNELEANVSPSSITFSSENWASPQTVTVTGVNDPAADGDQEFTVVLGACTSGDADYDGIDPDDVAGINHDDETAGIIVSAEADLTTSEAGDAATFTVVLQSRPAASVSVALTSTNPAEGTVPGAAVFTSENWDIPQMITVMGVDDHADDGDVAYEITVGPASGDDAYDGLTGEAVSITNLDDDSAGFTLAPTSIATTEGGGTATFTVVLDSQPSADVSFDITSSDTGEGTVDVSTLTFTTDEWSTPQTVTVTGVDDASADGAVPYTINVHVASTTDAAYLALADQQVDVSNSDDELPGITVSPTSGLTTSESGTTTTFTVVLNSLPSDDVEIALSSDTPSEGTIATPTLIFTPVNWNVAQSVTVSGVDDAIDDGDRVYHIVTGAAVSADSGYDGIDPSDVSIANTDNDSAGVTISPSGALSTTEAGATATVSFVLTAQPTDDVTISLTSSDTTEGTVSSSSVVFSASNWNVPQTVTVSGVDDSVTDGDVSYVIATGAIVSADMAYSGLAVPDLTVTNADNDVAAVIVTPTTLTTTEAGASSTFTIVLGSQPTASVAIALTSSDTTEGTVAPSSVTFSSLTWNTPQTVTVTGVDDGNDDGDVAYTITTSAATSADANYSGLAVADVSVTNTDNDTAGVTLSSTSVATTEGGSTVPLTAVLTAQPTANVSFSLTTGDSTEGTVSPSTLTFTTSNWNVPQNVVVTPVDDAMADGPISYTITTSAATSTDAAYSGLAIADITVVNADNETAGVTVTPTVLTTVESGGAPATFNVVLTSQPTANVTISLMSSDTTEGTVTPSALVFTSANWNTPQIAGVSGVDDSIVDGNVAYTIVTGSAVSADSAYSGMAVNDVSVINTDNEVAGATVTPTSGLSVSEAGTTASFTVVLNAEPSSAVTIGLTSSDTTEGSVSPSTLTFTAMNWSTPQTVTITGVDDALADGSIAYSIVTGATVSSDAAYNGIVVSDVTATTTDNDTAGVVVTPTSGLATSETGASTTFTVVLTAAPAANATISLTSSNVNEVTVSPATLTFTAMNWNMTQTVTVTGVNDGLLDGNTSFTVVTGSIASTDPSFNGLAVPDVSGTNQAYNVYVKPSAIRASDNFGTRVAVSADGSTLAVSSVGEDSNATGIGGSQTDNTASNAGAVYVFARSGSTWVQQAYIKASNTSSGDQFGIDIALSSDGSTLAVGAAYEDSNATGINGDAMNESAANSGAVYVFVRSGTTWTQEAYVKSSNSGTNDGFGTSVSLANDGNTLAVGANGEASSATGINGTETDNSVTFAGAVYLFTRSAATWTQQAYIKASNSGAGDQFGSAVSLSGDGNLLAVGALSEASNATGIGGNQANNSASGAGAVYIFVRSGVVWTQEAYIKASNAEANDGFGGRLDLSSDGSTLAVAAFNEDSSATGIGGNQMNNAAASSGAVYIFVRTGMTWAQESYIKASNSEATDYFGYSVRLSTNGNALAVGAFNEASSATGIGGNQADNTAPASGAVYTFSRSAGVWTQQQYVKAPNTNGGDSFGICVDLTSTGSNIVIGASGEGSNATTINGDQSNNSLTGAGAVYIM